tara:strand:+ start:55750 stop:57447 length:1698 start_codon:yes stop_codon:yes gene_type:complete
MNNLKNSKYLLSISILIVFLINVIQGSNTELLPDEAYYWVYSQYMDWGFFDHPPLVALWISISDFLFVDELGVRFFSAVSFAILTYLVWITIDHPKKKEYTWLFLLIFFSTAMLNVYGFITTPDTPLLLFLGLFLYAYKEYLKKQNILSYILLSVSIAGMMYSKYQAILIVFFIILSNFKLLKDYKLWLASLGALLLYLPHLDWQWANDFPSFRYHLQERVSNRTYKFEHTLMHFVNMIAILGFTFPIMYKAFFKSIKTKDAFMRGLNFIIIGFLVFFFFSSFRGRVQAQWIVPISIPLLLITFRFLTQKEKSRTWFIRLAVLNIAVMLVARVLMSSAGSSYVSLNTHGNESWALELKSKTKGQEKIFINSYQNTATYWYYTGEKAYYMKNFTGRNNHFLMLQKKEDLSAKQAALVSRIRLDHTDFGTHIRGKDSVFTTVVNHYNDLSQLKVSILNDQIILNENSINTFEIEIENNFNRTINLDDFEVRIGFIKAKKKEKFTLNAYLKTNSSSITKGETIKGIISFDTNDFPNPEIFTTLGIGITNSNKIDIIRVSKLHKYQLKD